MSAMSLFFSITCDLITEEVLCRLSLVDLISCLSTCKRLHELVTSSTNVIYLMELEMTGMVDNPHCSYEKYPRSKRLEMLLEHRTRWEKLDCQWRKDIRLPVAMKRPLSNDVLSSERHLLLLPPNDQIDQISDIHSTPLPDHPDVKVRWDKISLGNHIYQAITALHEHDLLVCFTITSDSDDARMQIHLIRHSTGGPHPHADFPMLDICTEYNVKPPEVTCISIAGAHLAFLLTYRDGPHDDTTFLNLWNWKSGQHLVEMVQELPEGGSLFLREDLLMVFNMKDLSFDIYCIFPESGATRTNGIGGVQRIQSLLLPQLVNKASLKYIYFNQLQRSIVSNPSSSFAQHGLQECPFINDPLSAIVCAHLFIVQSSDHNMMCDFVSPLRTFLAHAIDALDTYQRVEYPKERPCIVTPVPWNLWGPKSTRWFPSRVNRSPSSIEAIGSKGAYGARCFLVHLKCRRHPVWRLHSISSITLLDFDKWRVRRSCSQHRVLETSCIPAGVLFSEPVESNLPYICKDLPVSLDSDRDKGDVEGNGYKNLWAPMCMNEQQIIRFLVSSLDFLSFHMI